MKIAKSTFQQFIKGINVRNRSKSVGFCSLNIPALFIEVKHYEIFPMFLDHFQSFFKKCSTICILEVPVP